MKIVVQRVNSASVKVENEIVGKIEKGYLLFVCFEQNDDTDKVEKAVAKILQLRINEDENSKMNLNIAQIEGHILSVSQFTLSWDGKKGHRPSFENSMPPGQAKLLYHLFNQKLKDSGIPVQMGIFGAEMQVESVGDGPVTFFLDF